MRTRPLYSSKLSGVAADHGSHPPPEKTVSDGVDSHLQASAGTSVAGDGAGPSPSSPVDTAFYPDLSTPELHAELVRLGAVLQTRSMRSWSGLIA